MEQLDDIDLDALRRPDDAAWARVFACYVRELRSMAERRVGDWADDVVSETFKDAFLSIERFVPGTSFRTWLFAIANHKILDLLRHQYRHPTHGETELSRVPARDDAAAVGERLDLCALERTMTRTVREAYELYYKHDLSITEISAQTGRSVDSIKQCLRRARDHMRHGLS